MNRYPHQGARLYVGNLPHDVTEREVEELFYKFGRIRDIEVKRSRNQDSAFAFVLYDDRYAVDDAIERRDGMRFGDMCLRVERGGDRRGNRGGGDGGGYGPPRRSAFRVRVYGLPPTASWQDLKDHMRRGGDVGFANVENRVGIVEYPTREEMEYAIKVLDRSEFCNIFHRAEIRVERDDGYGADDGYRGGYGGRSRSRSPYRERSRSRRRDRESPRRRSRSGARSASASPRGGAADDRYPSPRKDRNDKSDAVSTHDHHTRSRSASRSSARQARRSVDSRERSKSPSPRQPESAANDRFGSRSGSRQRAPES